MTDDEVTTLITGIDNYVLRISRIYEGRGMAVNVTSGSTIT